MGPIKGGVVRRVRVAVGDVMIMGDPKPCDFCVWDDVWPGVWDAGFDIDEKHDGGEQ
jgi:hypothetical protein